MKFDHFLYVVECADGTLYTGYATDVEARIAQHNSSKAGAHYTKARRPVTLRASARFFSKEQAMRAEYYFKRLTRSEKEAALTAVAHTPFEEVLAERIPALRSSSVFEVIAKALYENQDTRYHAFITSLIPTIDPARIIGVRTPALRVLAKQTATLSDAPQFLKRLPHKTFEENQLHAFIISDIAPYKKKLAAYERFLPFVDNWATCDQLSSLVLASQPEATLEAVRTWLTSPHAYTVRFAIKTLMQCYLDDLFTEEFPELVAQIHFNEPCNEYPHNEGKCTTSENITREPSCSYYVNMMRAWYFAEALVHQQEVILPYFLPQEHVKPTNMSQANTTQHAITPLDEQTRRMALRKACESRRVSPQMKTFLRTLR